MPYKEVELVGIGTARIYKRKRSRSIRLTVVSNEQIRLTIPFWTPYQAAIAFAVSRQKWILDQRQLSVQTLLKTDQPIGKMHRLRFLADRSLVTVRTRINDSTIEVHYNPKYNSNDAKIQAIAHRACLRALRLETEQMLQPRLRYLAVSHNFHFQTFRTKLLKSRWGSCDSDGNIVINLYLVQLPWECIDYVLLHELCHTKALHHGPGFWRVFESVLPSARRLRRQLRSYRPTLLLA